MTAPSKRPERAAYQSSLREEQAQRTGERILEALAEQLDEEGWETFSIARVAARAGVSEPTVYRHFPNREAMVEALSAWLEERVVFPTLPTSVDEIPVLAHALFDHFHENAPMVRASLQTRLGREVSDRGRRRRDREKVARGAEVFRHLPPAEARAASAVLRVLFSRESWVMITGRLGIEPSAASAAVSWAAKALIDAARRDEKLGRPALVAPETVAAADHMRREARARRSGAGRK
jgi:AcrR family transcriptional regulator